MALHQGLDCMSRWGGPCGHHISLLLEAHGTPNMIMLRASAIRSWCSLWLLPLTQFVSYAEAQSLSSLPQCGVSEQQSATHDTPLRLIFWQQTCINNMLGQAVALGCPASNGIPDTTCLCSSLNFGYGVRDCTIEACPSGTDTNVVIQYALNYCGK